MQLKSPDISIYKLDDNGAFDALGEVIEYTSLIWPDKYNGYAEFELYAPVTSKNKNLLKRGNYIWCGGDNACKIEIVTSESKDNGQKTYHCKGRTLECLLTTRIIWGTYNCINKHASTAMYEIVNSHCANPSDFYRKIPFLECAKDEQLGKVISFQKTGGEVYEAVENLASDSDLGFDVLFRPREKKLIFKVTEGIDRTISLTSGDESNLVIFSTDLEDILSSSYYTNDQDLKTLALVMGEGEGADRKSITSGNAATKGFSRREAYIDARDIQSEVMNADGTTTVINFDEYNDLLDDRGKERLSESTVVETFEAQMRVIGNIQYKYGEHYSKGDKVIVQDTELGIQVIARVAGISENFDDEYELEITFGYEPPTLSKKLKRQISNMKG